MGEADRRARPRRRVPARGLQPDARRAPSRWRRAARRCSARRPRRSPHADVCITMLADDAALEAVVLGEPRARAARGQGTALVDMSTVSVAVVASGSPSARPERASSSSARRSAATRRVVRGGTLTIVVSGPGARGAAARPAAARDRAEGLLRRRGRARARREARAPGARRRNRRAARRGARARRVGRRRPGEAARGDRRVGRRLAVHRATRASRCCATTTRRRSRRR